MRVAKQAGAIRTVLGAYGVITGQQWAEAAAAITAITTGAG